MASCQTYHPLNKHNYFNGSILYNDPLNIRFKYFGDINFETLSKIDKTKIKNTVKDVEGITTRDLLAYGVTNLNPEYQIMLFVKNVKKEQQPTQKIELVLNDTTQNRVLYKKIAGDKIAYLLLDALDTNKSIKSITNDGLSLMKSLSVDNVVEEELNYSDVFDSNRDDYNYLETRDKLKKAPVTESNKNEWMQFQFLATVNSFMANNSEYERLIQEFETKRKDYLKPFLDTLLSGKGIRKNVAVIKEISVLARDTRIVMLNENHWYPKHRFLGYKLLKPLKEKGYTHLALEALFQNQDSILNHRGFPTFSSGYYTRETFFGHFIRKAKELGFEIMEYESYNKNVNRELGQAQNLADLLKKNPDSKVFVYAGLDHILEEPTDRGKSMAVYLKELTHINPLTINQVDVVSETTDELVLIPFTSVENIDKLHKRNVDFFIINNLEPVLSDIFSTTALKKIVIQEEVLEKYIGEDLLVNVYQLNEYNSFKSRAVPILSKIERVSDEKTIEMTLPPGEYFLKLISVEDDNVLMQEVR